MATKIDDLTAASALDGTEGVHVVQGGNSRLGTAGSIAAVLTTSGLWIPVLSDGTNDVSAYSIQVGTYIKFGNLVYIQGKIAISSLASVSGSLRITGLPFTSHNVANGQAAISVGEADGLAIPAEVALTGFVEVNATHIRLKKWNLTTGTLSLQSGDFSADGLVGFSALYAAA